MSPESIRRGGLQEYLREQGERCGKENWQMATESQWSLSPTEEEIFSCSTDHYGKKTVKTVLSPPGCIGEMPEAQSSQKYEGNGTSNIWSMEVRQCCRSIWPCTQEAVVCWDVSWVNGRGGMGLWLGARAWKTADWSSIPGFARLPVLHTLSKSLHCSGQLLRAAHLQQQLWE